MPAPYSDNMYSDGGQSAAAAGDDSRDDALSPTDGYFHASGTSDAASSQQFAYQGQQDQQDQQHRRTSSSVPAVPNVMVEDPTLQDKAALKAREAEQERQLINNPDSSRTSSPAPFTPQTSFNNTAHSQSASGTASTASPHPSHHHRRSVEEDETPLIFPGDSTRQPYSHPHPETTSSREPNTSSPGHARPVDAPPAYSPSPSSPPLSPAQTHSYQTFAPTPNSNNTNNHVVSSDNMGVPEEHQSLLPRQPQSMGGSPGGAPESRWQRVKKQANKPSFRSKIRTLLGIAVILSIFFAIFGGVSITRTPHTKIPKIIDRDPVKTPNMGGEHDIVWRPSGGCRNTPHNFGKATSKIQVGSGYRLHIEQRPEKDGFHRRGPQPNIFGELVLRSAPDSSKDGTIELEVISNDEKLSVDSELHVDGGDQYAKFITPRNLDWWKTGSEAPCIQMRITLYVPKNGYFDSLNLDLVHLDVDITEGLTMGAVDVANIHTVVGDVKTPRAADLEDDTVPYSIQSRRIIISTVSGDVNGWFPLYDLLKVDTASGDINAQVVPKAADEKSDRFATLEIGSVSGTVKIEEPLDSSIRKGKPGKKLPARDYVVKVSTASGDIALDAVATSRTDVQSVSGSLKLRILPLLDTDKKGNPKSSALRTDTKSGQVTLNLLEPLNLGTNEEGSNKDVGLTELRSDHNSISGDLKLFYPGSWSGNFQAETMSGDISVKGKDVKITKRSGMITKSVRGEKGEGHSYIKMNTMSGDIQLKVGQE